MRKCILNEAGPILWRIMPLKTVSSWVLSSMVTDAWVEGDSCSHWSGRNLWWDREWKQWHFSWKRHPEKEINDDETKSDTDYSPDSLDTTTILVESVQVFNKSATSRKRGFKKHYPSNIYLMLITKLLWNWFSWKFYSQYHWEPGSIFGWSKQYKLWDSS